MKNSEKKLWGEAYEFAHVGADLTGKGFEGKPVDLSWLEGVAKGLLTTVRMLKKRKAKSGKAETLNAEAQRAQRR